MARAAEEEVMRSGTTIKGAAIVAALLVVVAVVVAVRVTRGVAQDFPPRPEPERVSVSVYETEAEAREALSALEAAQDRGEVNLEARALVVRGADGKVKVKDRRAKGTRAGQAVAAMATVLGGRSGLGVGATATSAVQYLESNVIAMPQELVTAMQAALAPGQAAVVSAVDGKSVAAATALQQSSATVTMNHDLPTYVVPPENIRRKATPLPAPVIAPGSP
jgi:hypothetical protein